MRQRKGKAAPPGEGSDSAWRAIMCVCRAGHRIHLMFVRPCVGGGVANDSSSLVAFSNRKPHHVKLAFLLQEDMSSIRRSIMCVQ